LTLLTFFTGFEFVAFFTGAFFFPGFCVPFLANFFILAEASVVLLSRASLRAAR